jgi:hypothetical protein
VVLTNAAALLVMALTLFVLGHQLPRNFHEWDDALPVFRVLFVIASVAVILNTFYRHPLCTATSFGGLLIGVTGVLDLEEICA